MKCPKCDFLNDEQDLTCIQCGEALCFTTPIQDVSVSLYEAGRASLVVKQELMRGAHCLAEAVITLACVDAVNFKPVKMPPTILQALTHTT